MSDLVDPIGDIRSLAESMPVPARAIVMTPNLISRILATTGMTRRELDAALAPLRVEELDPHELAVFTRRQRFFEMLRRGVDDTWCRRPGRFREYVGTRLYKVFNALERRVS